MLSKASDNKYSDVPQILRNYLNFMIVIKGIFIFFKGIYSEGHVTIDGYKINVPEQRLESLKDYEGKEIYIGIRPEYIHLANEGINVEAEVVELLGSELIIHSTLDNTKFCFKVSAKTDIKAHSNVCLKFEEDELRFFDLDTEVGIY